MYDIIGDIHGHDDALVELLETLGYQQRGGCHRHPERIAVFVGDFLDRGPHIRRVLDRVRAMLDAGAALAVMGNHEFNALAYHTPHPKQAGEFLRAHNEKNTRQHQATLDQLPGGLLHEHLAWLRELPLWLELDGLRVAHACWDSRRVATLHDALARHGGVSDTFLAEATAKNEHDLTTLYRAVEEVLKGKETELPAGESYQDKDGHTRTALRFQWYRLPRDDDTYASYALSGGDGLPARPIPPAATCDVEPYPADAPPFFCGHYWLFAARPARLAANVACVDYSVAKGGVLCAYRWQGERELRDAHFVTTRPRG